MDEFVSVVILSQPGETEPAFKERLSQFWTQILRQYPEDFEKIYAERTAFETRSDQRLSRQYLVEEEVVDALEGHLTALAMDYEPIDHDDVYGKYEATGADWMQIEHH